MKSFQRLLACGLFVLGALGGAACASAADTAVAVGSLAGIGSKPPAADVCQKFAQGQAVKLLVDGVDSGVRAVGCSEQADRMQFKLSRPTGSSADPAAVAAAWERMLGRPWDADTPDFRRRLNFQLQQADDKGNVSTVDSGKFELRIFSGPLAAFGVALVLGVWIGLLVLGARSGLVRDAGNAGTDLAHRTYSLARVQMAWWFAIIVGAYVFLWVITGDTPVLGAQALGLMGVSGATTLSAVGVDSGKNKAMPRSDGFWLDLLTDADGVTLHRFQMLAMTVVLGVIFIVHVVSHLAMPEFDGNTLLLLGISSGTYVGLKVPEKHTSDDAAAGDAAPAAGAADPKAGYTPLPDSTGAKT